MKPLQDELTDYTDPRNMDNLGVGNHSIPLPEAYYACFHLLIDKQHKTELVPFIRSTVDEARFLKAEKYSKTILALSDHEDAAKFRDHVLRRETHQEMAYEKQRDHSGHTVSNYLMGWYVFSHSSAVEELMRPHIRRRYQLEKGQSPNSSIYHKFGNIWTFVSLLHDVGYAFEGALSQGKGPAAPSSVREMARNVSKFFSDIFEMTDDPKMKAYRSKLALITGQSPLQISDGSLGEVSDSLSQLGDLSTLWAAVLLERPDWKKQQAPPGDVFKLWEAHYRHFGQLTMANRMADLEASYRHQYEVGMFKEKVRLLDHGVVGAMMLLQHSTTYFQIVMALKAAKRVPGALKTHFTIAPSATSIPYHASHWWAGVVWATAAVAIHNIQQFNPWPGCADASRRQLRLEDDPLAFLGILVDVLQEWDRPKSSRGEFFRGKTPVSSGDCRLGTSRGKILISYGSEQVAEDVMNNLDKALDGWRDVIELR